MARVFAAALVVSFILAAASTARATESFTGLGDLPNGDFDSLAYGISADGFVVVGGSNFASGSEAFRWTAFSWKLGGELVGLGFLVGGIFPQSTARGTSADGSVVVGNARSASGGEAFRWTSGGGMVGLGDLAGGSFSSIAYGTSADGSVVVGRGDSGDVHGNEAFRWTSGGGMVGLGDLAGGNFFSIAYGISADGSVVVGQSHSASGNEAFRWTSGGGMVGLGTLAGGLGFYSKARGVSADGSVVVGDSQSASGLQAFRWTSGGGMVGLGDLPGGDIRSFALGTSADGSVVVGNARSASGDKAFIWDQTNGMRLLKDVLVNDFGLDLTRWTLETATAISADGLTIVGYGIRRNGDREAWIADLDNRNHHDLPGLSVWGVLLLEVLLLGSGLLALAVARLRAS